MTRLAWFSPLPPDRSGIAAYSAELLGRLDGTYQIDRYPASLAHAFVWRARQTAYDLVVYQMGNSPAHDYLWGYLPRYPGLVLLHDARLHHARARQLLAARRFDDYRAEFAFNHPGVAPEAAEYAIEGLAGSIYYFWPMLRTIMTTARAVAVHNRWVADDLAEQYPGAPVSSIRMGVPPLPVSADARAQVRAALGVRDSSVVFLAFGKVTAEKRIAAIMRALAALVRDGVDAWLMLVGDADAAAALVADNELPDIAGRVKSIGFVADDEIGRYLAAADACLCLRWPSAQETSASWLRCLAAGRATIITSLAHLADVPETVAVRVDLLDEDASLLAAMRRLAADVPFRDGVGEAGYRHWLAHHTLDAMADDYHRLIALALSRPVRSPAGLPPHWTRDYSESARATLDRFGVSSDL